MALLWNDVQREIAALLQSGKSAYQIAEKDKLYKPDLVYKVARALKEGDTPEAFDAQQDTGEQTVVNEETGEITVIQEESKPQEGDNGGSPAKLKTSLELALERAEGKRNGPGGKSDSKAGKPKKEDIKLTPSASEAAFLKMELKALLIQQTPSIYAGYMTAIARGFTGNMESFLSIAVVDYWLGREINPFLVTSGFKEIIEEALDGNKERLGVGGVPA